MNKNDSTSAAKFQEVSEAYEVCFEKLRMMKFFDRANFLYIYNFEDTE